MAHLSTMTVWGCRPQNLLCARRLRSAVKPPRANVLARVPGPMKKVRFENGPRVSGFDGCGQAETCHSEAR